MKTPSFVPIILTNFDPLKSGIYSTALGIISQSSSISSKIIFSYQNKKFFEEISSSKLKPIVFTYLEYPEVSKYLKVIKPLIVHVGDWPLTYRLNELKIKKTIYSLIKLLFSFSRIVLLSRRLNRFNFIFVNEAETELARRYGLRNSFTVGIGVDSIEVDTINQLDPKRLTFSGNFDYNPNKDAALSLIEFAKTLSVDYEISIVGYNADNLKTSVIKSAKINLFSNVESVIETLSKKRGVYLSFISYGSGSKNKILQALCAGCYVIASEESLDRSMDQYGDAIFRFNIKESGWQDRVKKQLEVVGSDIGVFGEKTNKVRTGINDTRGWKSISKKFTRLLAAIEEGRA